MKAARNTAAGLSAVALAGCLTPGPDYDAPEPAAFASTSFLYGDELNTQAPLASWWRTFEDPALDELVSLGRERNRTLIAAAANLRAARAELGLARKDRLPFDTIEGTIQETRTAAAPSPFAGDEPLPNVSLVSLGLNASWELDLFGRITRTIEIADAQTGAAAADLLDLRAVITADIVDAYVDMRGAQARLAVAEANAEAQAETLDLTIVIRDVGSGTDLDVQRARAQLETTRSLIPGFRAEAVAAANALAVLTGRTPEALVDMADERGDVPLVTGPVAVGDPADLLRRRPDIAASERLLAAETSSIGLAISEAFPRVDLLGSIALQSDGFSRFGTAPSLGFAVGPSVTWSITDVFRARDRAAAAGARAEAAFAVYEETILSALSETETALETLSRAGDQAVHLRAAETASAEAARLARLRYERGVTSFLDVLDAELRALEAADQRVDAEIAVARAQVAVFRALRAGV